MASNNYLKIVDRDGWRKEFPLAKNLFYIGSGPHNDIVLEHSRGGGVSQRHLQVIALPEMGKAYRVINLGDMAITLGGRRSLSPHATAEVAHDELIQVGDFTLSFHGLAALSRSSQLIGLTLSLPSPDLYPDREITGVVTVSNLGDQAGVQFQLELRGLPTTMYELGPGPLLFPNATKSIPLRIWHPRAPLPPAGELQFTLRATAPEAYPEENAMATAVLRVAPFYNHTLRVTEVV